jgi:hypothetical protein
MCFCRAVSAVLQLLHHGAFMVLLHAAARVIFSCVDHAVVVGQLLEATLSGINTPARCAVLAAHTAVTSSQQLGNCWWECYVLLPTCTTVALQLHVMINLSCPYPAV